jgi:hypothetical protein
MCLAVLCVPYANAEAKLECVVIVDFFATSRSSNVIPTYGTTGCEHISSPPSAAATAAFPLVSLCGPGTNVVSSCGAAQLECAHFGGAQLECVHSGVPQLEYEYLALH